MCTAFGTFAIYLITIISALPYDGWIEHTSPPLPQSISDAAVGYNPQNHTIWLLGDVNYPKRLISFDYTQHIFTNHGSNILPIEVRGDSQYYAQIDSTLYIADYSSSYINSFNMQTMEFKLNYSSTPYTIEGPQCCIVNIRNDYIGVLGHDTVVQILHIDSLNWFNSVPQMQESRIVSSCIYLNDKIFSIGGFHRTLMNYISSIEYLNVTATLMNNLESTSWQYTKDYLPQRFGYSRSISVNDDILVIGGRNDVILNTIYAIDSITGSVSLVGHLAAAVWVSATIFVNNIIYSFGGQGFSDGWQTKSLYYSTTTYSTIIPSGSSTAINVRSTTSSSWTSSSTQNSITSSITSSISTVDFAITTDNSTSSNISAPTPFVIDESSNTEEYTDNIWNGTMINITLIISPSISIDNVLYTINTTITKYLISKDIASPLQTNIIYRQETVIIVVDVFHKLDKDVINAKEIEDELNKALYDEYDGKVKVKAVTVDTDNSYDDTKSDSDGVKSVDVFLILGVIASSVCVVLILSGIICLCIRSKKKQHDDGNNSKVVRNQMVRIIANKLPMQQDIGLQNGDECGEESVSSSHSSLYNMEGLKHVDAETTGGNTKDATYTTGANTTVVTP